MFKKFKTEATYTVPPMPQPARTAISDSAFLHTAVAGAWLPFQRSLISGLFVGLIVCVISLRFFPDDWLFVSVLSALLTAGLSWLFFQVQWSRLVGLVEIAVNRDIDGRAGIGNYQQPQPVEVEDHLVINLRTLDRDGGDSTQRLRMPLSPATMRLIADGILTGGKSLAEKYWIGKGNIFGDQEWASIITAMVQSGFIVPKNKEHPNLGYEPTKVGRAVFQHYATPLSDDSPDENSAKKR